MRPVPGTPPVKLFLNKDKTNLSILRPGDNFTGGANLDPIVCSMYWDVYVYYTPFYVYDPKGDGSHPDIFCVVANDGVYHGWDNNPTHFYRQSSSWQHALLS